MLREYLYGAVTGAVVGALSVTSTAAAAVAVSRLDTIHAVAAALVSQLLPLGVMYALTRLGGYRVHVYWFFVSALYETVIALVAGLSGSGLLLARWGPPGLLLPPVGMIVDALLREDEG